jgi:hypothetical protein
MQRARGRLEATMTGVSVKTLASSIALLALGFAQPLFAQVELGTWVRKPTATQPGMTMIVEACCNGGRRLTYRFTMDNKEMRLTVESRLDGKDAPVLVDGKPSGETMAITRVDARHANAVLKMNGTFFGTAKGTLSQDAKTLTVVNDYSSSAGGHAAGKYTEVWVKQ